MSARHIQTRLLTHSEKVCSLYKRALRNLWSFYEDRAELRYHATLLRQRFDEKKNEKDMRKAKMYLLEGEKELEKNMHYQPRKFAYSPGGINYERVPLIPDWVMDAWHPLEKAQYPKYFAIREQRKQEYIEWWERKYGKPEFSEAHDDDDED